MKGRERNIASEGARENATHERERESEGGGEYEGRMQPCEPI